MLSYGSLWETSADAVDAVKFETLSLGTGKIRRIKPNIRKRPAGNSFQALLILLKIIEFATSVMLI